MAPHNETRPQEGTGLADLTGHQPDGHGSRREEEWAGWLEKLEPVMDQAVDWMIDHGWLDLGETPRFTPPEVTP
jgi:hypothetical protein